MRYLKRGILIGAALTIVVACDDNALNSGVQVGTPASGTASNGGGTNEAATTTSPVPTWQSPSTDVVLESRRIAIVYSQTSSKQYFDEFAYGQMFTAMQQQAVQAGVPFDLLTEDDLANSSALLEYDVLLIPLLSHVKRSIRNDIINSLKSAQANDVSIVTSSEFLTYDENNQPFTDPYSAMIEILGITPNGYQVGVPTTVKVSTQSHPITRAYSPNAVLNDYAQTWFGEFLAVTPAEATVLATGQVGTATHTVVQALDRASRVVHFANDEFLADGNMLWRAISWAMQAEGSPVHLHPSRSNSVFIARNDMDQAMVAADLINTEIPLLGIIRDWYEQYSFVSSYYLDIGNNPAQGYYTNWSISSPLYQQYIELENEIGTHSWTHPHYTSQLSDSELEFEFNQSKQEISQQLGIDVIGGAVPGNPENLNVVENLNQWFEYFSGRSITGANGYRSGIGFLNPAHNMRYFNLNTTPDFGLIDFQGKTPDQARQIWREEIDTLYMQAKLPVIHWLWHDYGPTTETVAGRYSRTMFEDTIAHAHDKGAEFVTLADYHRRMTALESVTFSTASDNKLVARLEGEGLGQFGLRLPSGQSVASVQNWYAFNGDTVFVPENGGTFIVSQGNTAADVTRISSLPMRARLFDANGTGDELYFTVEGFGEVTIELSGAMTANANVTGADFVSEVGSTLRIKLNGFGLHTVAITAQDPISAP